MKAFRWLALALLLFHPASGEAPLWLTMPSGQRVAHASFEDASAALREILLENRHVRLTLELDCRKMGILRQSDVVRVNVDGRQVQEESFESYLQKLDAARHEAREAVCRDNLRLLRQALLTWRQDHDGQDPVHLNELTPYYIKSMPRCPFSSEDSYSDVYQEHKECRCSGPHL